jgi:hypothetical protein
MPLESAKDDFWPRGGYILKRSIILTQEGRTQLGVLDPAIAPIIASYAWASFGGQNASCTG